MAATPRDLVEGLLRDLNPASDLVAFGETPDGNYRVEVRVPGRPLKQFRLRRLAVMNVLGGIRAPEPLKAVLAAELAISRSRMADA